MKHQVQIVISRPSGSQGPGASPSRRPLNQLKLIFGSILFAAVAVGILIVVLILGSIIAAVIWIGLVAVTVTFILKAAVRRAHQ